MAQFLSYIPNILCILGVYGAILTLLNAKSRTTRFLLVLLFAAITLAGVYLSQYLPSSPTAPPQTGIHI